MKNKKQNNHVTLAVAGLVIAVIVAAGAFYYIWQVQGKHGQAVTDTISLGQLMWKKEQLQAQYAAGIEDYSNICNIRCVYGEHPERASQLKQQAYTGCGVNDPFIQQNLIDRGYFIVDMHDGYCSFR
ncbi:hypothetical protein COV18_03190 [Candidatus Woesearchaeota archaeon CG10_big_fil_rev_8_21_14_0_10_37_12]|nr:MAG: hypothetical protein COV18_03190 [Candidatus Woesearchaeota archaeon CG10_big_fil_rev_8_21_14_0_10_37_12]